MVFEHELFLVLCISIVESNEWHFLDRNLCVIRH